MFRDPRDSQPRRLQGFYPEVFSEYDGALPRIIAPPRGYEDTTTFYEPIKSAQQIQSEFIAETPIYEDLESALNAIPETSSITSAIMQSRRINAYTVDEIKTPREVELSGSQRHWDHLVATLPKDARVSLAQGIAIVEYEIKSDEDNLSNTATMILDLAGANEKDGFRILNFLQTGENGTLSPTAIFSRDNIEVRFKEEYSYVRFISKILKRRTRGSARVVNNKNRIDINEVSFQDPDDPDFTRSYTDIPLFYHELSHIKDKPARSLTNEEYKTYLSAYLTDKYIPLAIATTTMSAMTGTALPWTLLFTGGLITLDRILQKMSRDPNTLIGKTFLKRWQTEVEARFSQKIAADTMYINGFVADRKTFRNILDYYQPNSWTYADRFSRICEASLNKYFPRQAPQPIPTI